MIQEIELSKLRVHPNNVRKTYNDIDELAESIKAQGILQNLTVVKNPEEEGTYWVVIGNRRLTVALQAGIVSAPCQIVEMDEKNQALTMLLENMQRSDLTIYEQSHGIQMVLDLGETEDGLAEKTGLSKSTIRHRVNIAKLNPDTLQKKEQEDGFQLSLKDLYELEKIPDIKKRDKILKEAQSSNDLAQKAKSCVLEMKRKENEKKYAAAFKKLGIRPAPKGTENEMYSNKWETVKSYDLTKDIEKEVKLPKGEDAGKCFYIVYWREMKVIKKRVKEKRELTPEEKKQKEKERNRKQLRAMQKEMTAEREDFIRLAIEKKFKPESMTEGQVQVRLFNLMLDCSCWMNKDPMYQFLFKKREWEVKEEEEKAKVQKYIRELPLFFQFSIYANKAVSDKDVTEWNTKYHKGNGKILMEFESILGDFGFSYSKGEYKQVSDGTHTLFTRWKEKP